jgi:hypothetical protein
MPLSVLNYCLKNGLFQLVVLIVIAWIAWKVLVIYKDVEREQAVDRNDTGLKFDFLGKEVNGIDKKLDVIGDTIAIHSVEISDLKTVHHKWDLILTQKFKDNKTKELHGS